MTWDDIVAIEPGLAKMLDEARAVRPDGPRFCANHVWYTRFKPRLSRLVGNFANDPRLGSSEAYDIAYQRVYDALPACRRCSCL